MIKYVMSWGLLLIVVVLLGSTSVAQTALPRETYIDVARATVLITTEAKDPFNENEVVSISTTGFVVTESGFILTARGAFLESEGDVDLENAIFQIATFNTFESMPTIRYQAQYVIDYEELDLLVLRVRNDVAGNPIPSREISLNYIFTWGIDYQTTLMEEVYMISFQGAGALSSFTSTQTECINLSGIDDSTPSHSQCLDGGYYDEQTPGSVVVNSSGNVIGFMQRKGDIFIEYLPFSVVCEQVRELCENLVEYRAPVPTVLRHAVVCLSEDVSLPVRTNASENADRVDDVRIGDHVFILDNPSVTAEGIAWVRIQTVNGQRGWIQAIFNRATTLIGYISQRTDLEPIAVEPGSRAIVCATFPSDHSKLWNQPNGREIKRLLSGDMVNVTGQPLERDNGFWWPVIDIDGTAGWLVDTSDGTRNLIALPN